MNKSGKSLLAGSVMVLLAVGCAGGSKGTAPPATPGSTNAAVQGPTCSPNGTTVEISALKSLFDKDCLAVPANTLFTVKLDNQDAYSHNFVILLHPDGGRLTGDVEFWGDDAKGDSTTNYQVNALPPGTYYFRCNYHLLMRGTFVVTG